MAPDVARTLPQVFAKRQRSDYDDFVEVQASEIGSLRSDVEKFVRACEDAVNAA